MEMIFDWKCMHTRSCTPHDLADWIQSSGRQFSHDTAVDNRLKSVLLIIYTNFPRVVVLLGEQIFRPLFSFSLKIHWNGNGITTGIRAVSIPQSLRCGLCYSFFFTFSSGNDPKRRKSWRFKQPSKLFRFLILYLPVHSFHNSWEILRPCCQNKNANCFWTPQRW